MKRNNTYLVLCFISFSFLLIAEPAKKATATINIKDSAKAGSSNSSLFKNSEIDGRTIENRCDQIKEKVASGKCTPQEISIYSIEYKNFASHPDIEKETKIYREWYSKMYKFLDTMYFVLYQIESAEEEPENPKNKKIIETGRAEYKNLLDKFEKLAKSPAKIAGKKR